MRWGKGSETPSFLRSEHEERGSLRPFSPPQQGVSDPFSHRKREKPVHPKIPLAKIPLAQRMTSVVLPMPWNFVTHLPKGPFRTKNSTELESVVFCYRRSFSLSVVFSCLFCQENQAFLSPLRSVLLRPYRIFSPYQNSLSVVFSVREVPLGVRLGIKHTRTGTGILRRENRNRQHLVTAKTVKVQMVLYSNRSLVKALFRRNLKGWLPKGWF